MITIEIKEPIWKDKSVGLSVDKLKQAWNAGDREVLVTISYVDKQGKKMFPHVYRFDMHKRKQYKTMMVDGQTEVLLVPVLELGISSFGSVDPV